MGQNAKATDFLKECMADALIQKMQEKPFEKVTVNEIADLAGVNRSRQTLCKVLHSEH